MKHLKHSLRFFLLLLIYQRGFSQYQTVPDLPLNIIPGTGTVISGLGDDNFVGSLGIGFNFSFYGNNYSQFYLGSNGVISFGNGLAGSYGLSLPNNSSNNSICFANADLNCGVGNPSINYFTTGNSPNRILIINFSNVRHYSDFNNLTNVQIQLYETSNKIEIHCINNQSLSNSRTIGIQNNTGSTYSVTENSYNTLGITLFPTNGNTKINFVNRAVRFENCNASPAPPSLLASNGNICGSGVLISSTLNSSCSGSNSVFKGWSNGVNSNSIQVSTTATTLFTAFCELNGCTSYNTWAVEHFTAPSISPSTTQNLCQNKTLTFTAAVPVYPPLIPAIKWYKNGSLIPNQSGTTLTIQEAGTYKMSYTMYDECTNHSNEVTVNTLPIPNPPTISVIDTLISGCFNNTLAVNSCSNSYNIYRNFNNTTTYFNSSNISNSINLNQPGVYYVNCVGINGCSSINSNSAKMVNPKIDIWKNNQFVDAYYVQTCNTQNTLLSEVHYPPINQFTFQWSKNGTNTDSGPTSTYNSLGKYKIQMKLNPSGCVIASDSINFSSKIISSTPTIEICSPSTYNPFASQPTPIWDFNYSGGPSTAVQVGSNTLATGVDNMTQILANDDGSYLILGYSNSIAGNAKTEGYKGPYAEWDYWVIKVDRFGNKIWDRTYGGERIEDYPIAIKAHGGGYILAGRSNSAIGYDVSENPKFSNDLDIWILKIDENGNKLWDRKIGAYYVDNIQDIVAADDGGYLLASYSDAGIAFDKSVASKGGQDMWLIKIDANGNKIWDKVYGGTSTEYLMSISKATDGYLLAGNTYSGISGDVTVASRGGTDYWIVKIDLNGNKMWDKRFGGANFDFLAKSKKVLGGYLLGGQTYSPAGGDKTAISGGTNNAEMWVIKIDDNGNKIWDKTFGNGGSDLLKTLEVYNDSTYLVGGQYALGNNDSRDYYINRLDKNGNSIWEKTVGSAQEDNFVGAAITSDYGIVLGGTTFGGLNNSFDRTKGAQFHDYWLIKVAECVDINNPYTINYGETVRLKTISSNVCNTETLIWSNNSINKIIETIPSQTTTYRAKCYDPVSQCYGNDSNSLLVVVNCSPNQTLVNPEHNLIDKSVSIKATETINASNKISGSNSNILYQAEKQILLLPGFESQAKSVFKANISNCSN